MVEGEEVLFRPVLRGMYRAESLIDGSIDLAFVLLCNEALDIEAENQRRARAAATQAAENQPRRKR